MAGVCIGCGGGLTQLADTMVSGQGDATSEPVPPCLPNTHTLQYMTHGYGTDNRQIPAVRTDEVVCRPTSVVLSVLEDNNNRLRSQKANTCSINKKPHA